MHEERPDNDEWGKTFYHLIEVHFVHSVSIPLCGQNNIRLYVTAALCLKNFFFQTSQWSAGCVFAELLLGQLGDSGVDQLVEIIKVLGTPTKEQIRQMNSNYTEFKFPQIKAHPLHKVRTCTCTI